MQYSQPLPVLPFFRCIDLCTSGKITKYGQLKGSAHPLLLTLTVIFERPNGAASTDSPTAREYGRQAALTIRSSANDITERSRSR